MSAAEALAGIGTAGLGEEADEFRAQMRRRLFGLPEEPRGWA